MIYILDSISKLNVRFGFALSFEMVFCDRFLCFIVIVVAVMCSGSSTGDSRAGLSTNFSS